MLVLSRKLNEEIMIGDDIRIVVQRISGNRISLGIEAPSDVRIIRGELDPIATSFEQAADKQAFDSPTLRAG